MTRQDMTRPMCLELLTEPLYTFFFLLNLHALFLKINSTLFERKIKNIILNRNK